MKKSALRTLLAVVFVALCWFLVSAAVNRPFLPGPLETLKALFGLVASGRIFPHAGSSLYRILLATLIGLAAALPAGILLGRSPRVDAAAGPVFRILYPIPKVVLLPVFVVLFGLGDFPKILLIALVLFFQLAIVIRDAAKSIPAELADTVRVYGAGRRQTLRHLILPACLPAVFTALKSSLGISIALLFITEVFASFSGLGYFIMNQMDARNYPQMYAAIVALALLGVLLYWALERLEARVCRWQRFA